MKAFIVVVAVILVLAVSPTATAGMKNCKGDAARSNPPIPNNPLHLWNVIWRNTRAMCIQKSEKQLNNTHQQGKRTSNAIDNGVMSFEGSLGKRR